MAARRRSRRSSRLFLIAALGAATVGRAAAAPTDTAIEKLKEIEGKLTRARRDQDSVRSLKATLEEVAAVRAALRTTAAEARGHQVELPDGRATVDRTGACGDPRTAQLAVRRQALTAVTGALQTMVRRPPEAFVSGAFSALEMARTSALLDGAATRIAAAAGALRAQLATVAQTKAAIRVEQANLAVAVAAYERERGRLDILLAEKARLLATVMPPTRPGKRESRRWLARRSAGLVGAVGAASPRRGARTADRLAALAAPSLPGGVGRLPPHRRRRRRAGCPPNRSWRARVNCQRR